MVMQIYVIKFQETWLELSKFFIFMFFFVNQIPTEVNALKTFHAIFFQNKNSFDLSSYNTKSHATVEKNSSCIFMSWFKCKIVHRFEEKLKYILMLWRCWQKKHRVDYIGTCICFINLVSYLTTAKSQKFKRLEDKTSHQFRLFNVLQLKKINLWVILKIL